VPSREVSGPAQAGQPPATQGAAAKESGTTQEAAAGKEFQRAAALSREGRYDLSAAALKDILSAYPETQAAEKARAILPSVEEKGVEAGQAEAAPSALPAAPKPGPERPADDTPQPQPANETYNDDAGKQSVVVDPKDLKLGGPYRLPSGAPLMPELNPSDPLAAISKMLRVPPGGSITVISVFKKRGIPWYQVDAYSAANDLIGRGWVNSTALLGQRLDRVVKEAVPVPNRKEQHTPVAVETAMDERIRKAYRADPDRPLLSTLRFEDRKVTRIGKGSYEMVVVCSIVYPDRPTQRDRTRWHIRATHGPNGWQAELASLPEEA